MVATEEKQKYSLLFSVCGKCSSEGEVRGWCGDTESFRLVGKKRFHRIVAEVQGQINILLRVSCGSQLTGNKRNNSTKRIWPGKTEKTQKNK